MRIASFFSGEGGFDLSGDQMGWETSILCEKDQYCKYLLTKKWPNATFYDDITQADFSIHRGTIDILVGGFPCQPYSSAGKRIGKEDPRHLWPEMLRAISEIQPTWVVGENVLGLTNWNDGLVFDEIQSDLEAQGYEVQSFVLPAVAVNAPHRRERVFIVAHATKTRLQRREINRGFKEIRKNGNKQPIGQIPCFWENFPTQPPVCGGDDGLSSELVRRYVIEHSGEILTEKEINKIVSTTISKFTKESIKQHGNAVVPQVVLQIFKAIDQYEINLKHIQ